MNLPESQPSKQPAQQPPEEPVVPQGAEAPPPVPAPETATPTGAAEARVPAAGPAGTARRAKTEDFAFLARLPARKPETFDRDAITRAVLMVGGLALGLWLVMIVARPSTPVDPEPELPEESFVQEVAPITSTGNGLAPAPQDPVPTPEIISLTPDPAWAPPVPAPVQPQAVQAPGMQAPGMQPPAGQAPMRQAPAGHVPAMAPEAGAGEYDSGLDVAQPAVADTPDPSNLFTSP